jgi:DNA-directed RNA polymerase subunit RPC12/RpoP
VLERVGVDPLAPRVRETAWLASTAWDADRSRNHPVGRTFRDGSLRPLLTHRFHAWAFRRLFEYVEYEAEVVGISVEQVTPAYTSQRCSRCGTTLRENRQTRERFCCQTCGYEVNADYNAAKNVGLNHLRSAQTSSIVGAPVNVRLNRGTVNVNGEYSPAADGGQNGSPRESPTRNDANGEPVSE